MDFFTYILKKSNGSWVALCLENGLVGQGKLKDTAVKKLKESILSFEEERIKDPEIYNSPLSIKELHEFITLAKNKIPAGPLELRAVNA